MKKGVEKYWHIVTGEEFEKAIQIGTIRLGCGFVFGDVDENEKKSLWKNVYEPTSYEDFLAIGAIKGYKRGWAYYKAKECGIEVSKQDYQSRHSTHKSRNDYTEEYAEINGYGEWDYFMN